jgi:hypothetical protein
MLTRKKMAVTVAVAVVIAAAVLTFVRPASIEHASPGCPATVASAVLPDWARSGFSDPAPSAPYVLGEHGEIVAILFGDLSEPARPDRSNKILWVARGTSGPFTISATLGGNDSAPVVTTLPDGPGPSIVDLPAPGCWTFDLAWGAQRDTLRLPYAPG